MTIAVANYGQGGGVTETLPGGFTYESSSLAASAIEVTGQNVRFILQETTSFTYTVTASSTTGSHRFSGNLRDFERVDYDVGGASSVTVEATASERKMPPAPPGPLIRTTVAPGGQVEVTIAVANFTVRALRSEPRRCQPGSPTNPAVWPPALSRSPARTSGSSCKRLLPLRTPLPRPARRVPIVSPAF